LKFISGINYSNDKDNPMKTFTNSIFTLLVILLAAGCSGRGTSKQEPIAEADTISVPDTGFTGIRKYSRGSKLVKEITFKNGIRQGEMKSFYAGGQLYQTFWYENGLREDSARWYYTTGEVFRATPYVRDTVDGIQKQYYRNGKLKARIGYVKGLRAPLIEEYTLTGSLVTGYPDIEFSFTDNYNSTGKLKVNLGLTDKSTRVKFYRGEFTNGVFDTARCDLIKTTEGKAVFELRKTGAPLQDYVGVIAEITTGFGNKYLTSKKIELPYKDLK